MSTESAPAVRPPPTLATLLKRLNDYHALYESRDSSAVAHAITAHHLDTCICAGAMVGPPPGRWRVLRFSDYYREVFGRELDGRVVRKRA